MADEEGFDKILSNLIGLAGQSLSSLNYEQKIRLIMWMTEMSLRYRVSPEKLLKKMKEVEKILKKEMKGGESEGAG